MEKIRTTFATLVFLFLQSIIFAQIPAIQWTKTYGGVRFDIGISVSQTTDSGYVIAAEAASFSPSDSADFYIIRTNYIGDTIWTKVYGGDDQDWPRSIQQTSDGGFIVVGGTRSYGAGECDVYLVKTDANGDSIWTKTYGTISHEVGMAVQQTSDSGYIIAGWNGDYPDYNIYIIKTDSLGDTLWTRTYGGSYTYDNAWSVEQTSDGGYIVCGTLDLGNNNSDNYLIKLDPLGDTLWTRTYGGPGTDYGYCARQTSDGGYIVTGDRDGDVYIIKTDSNGDSTWTRTYGGSGIYDSGRSVQQTTDGGYIVGGYLQTSANYWDVYIIKTDEYGDSVWSLTVGGQYDEGCYSIQQTMDGGYIAVGDSGDIFGPTDYDIYLVKVAPESDIYEDITSQTCEFVNIEIFPNPFQNEIYINLQGIKASAAELHIFDVTGRLVREFTVTQVSPSQKLTITWDGCDNFSEKLPVGVYYLHCQWATDHVIRKIILLQ